MKHTSLAFLLLTLLSACGPGKDKAEPTNYNQFSSTKMVNMLTDIQLMESLISTHRDFRDKDKQKLFFQEILKKHEISQLEFDSILTFLENNLELYEKILDSVKIKLENMQTVDFPFLLEKDTLVSTLKPEN